MSRLLNRWIAGCALALLAAPSWSQPSPIAPRRPDPTSPAGARDPDDARPEGPVIAQLSVPLGRHAAAPRRPPPRASGASAVPVRDAAARCEAQTDAAVRAACRDRLAHETRPPTGR